MQTDSFLLGSLAFMYYGFIRPKHVSFVAQIHFRIWQHDMLLMVINIWWVSGQELVNKTGSANLHKMSTLWLAIKCCHTLESSTTSSKLTGWNEQPTDASVFIFIAMSFLQLLIILILFFDMIELLTRQLMAPIFP